MTEAPWGPDGRWRLWIETGVIEGFIELLDQQLAIPKVVHDHVGPQDPFHEPRVAALGVVPWLTHPGIIDRLRRMSCCVVVDKEAAVTGPLRQFHEEGIPFPAEAVPGFREDLAPVDENGRPIVVDPGSPWPPGPEAIGPVRVWGYMGKGKPLAHTKLLVIGMIARYKNYAWPEGGPGEYLSFTPGVAWFGSANWTLPASQQHLEMGAFTTDAAFVQPCVEYLSRVVVDSEPLGSTRPTKTPELEPVEFDDEAFAEYLAEYGGIDEGEW